MADDVTTVLLNKCSETVPVRKHANPALVGLPGFAIATLTLQFLHFGLLDERAPIVFSGFLLGGLAQIMAGIHGIWIGDDFIAGAFTTFGCFWAGLALMHATIAMNWMPLSSAAVSYFKIPVLCYAIILLGAVWRKPMAVFVTIASLIPGLSSIIIAHFLDTQLSTYIAGIFLTFSSLCAFYTLTAEMYTGVYGIHTWIPLGPTPYDLWSARARKPNKNRV